MYSEEIQLSVIVPFYNAQKYVNTCLDSITKIQKLSVEVICIDEGSTDDTLKILRSYALKDKRLRILQQENLYAGVARNSGMRVARGKYITFIDADDLLYSTETLYRAYKLSEERDCDFFACGAVGGTDVVNAQWEMSVFNRDCIPRKEIFTAGDLGIYAFKAFGGAPWAKLYRRAFIEENKLTFPNVPRSEDVCFVYQVICLAKRISCLEEALIFYRRNVQGSLENTKDKTPTIFWEVSKLLISRLKALGVWNKFSIACKLSYTNGIIYHLFSMNTFEGFEKVFLCVKKEIWPWLESIEGEPDDDGYRKNKLKIKEILKYDTAAEYIYAKSRRQGKSIFALEKSLKKVRKELEEQQSRERWKEDEIEETKEPVVKVSVIIPIYNVEEYLPECLESVINQSLKELEIICVNDGSSDNSFKIAQEYAAKDSRIVLVDLEHNQGLSIARNSGVQKATGEFIYFLDSDDTIAQEALEHLYLRAIKDELDLICFEGKTIFTTEELRKRCSWSIKWCLRKKEYLGVKSGKQLMTEMYCNNDYKSPVWILFIRRSFYEKEKLGFVPGMIFEDTLFTFECMLRAPRAAHVFEKYYIRKVREDSITSTKQITFKYPYGFFYSAMEMRKIACTLELNDEEQAAVNKEICRMLQESKVQLKRLNSIEFDKYLELPEAERVAFEQLVVQPYMNLKQLQKYQPQLEQKDAVVQEQKERIKQIEKILQEQQEQLEQKEIALQKANAQTKGLEKEKLELKKQLENVKMGWSFKLGRIITWVPRKLLGKKW